MKKIVFLLFIFLFMTGCGTSDEVRNSATLDNFSSVARSYNLTVSDNMETYKYYDYINGASKTTDEGISIEMVIYDTDDNANAAQKNHIESFDLLKSTGATSQKEKGKNYYKYVMISNGYYMISSRIDNTLIFCKTMLDNKDVVSAVFEELGY